MNFRHLSIFADIDCVRRREGAAAGEGKKKPVKAKLGEKNTMFYDDEVCCLRVL